MNVVLDIDCILEEAPASLILKPMKAVMMLEDEARIKALLDSEVLFKAWLIARMERFEHMQKVFSPQMFKGKD